MSSTPDSRYDHAYQDDIHQNADLEAELKALPLSEDYPPVKVEVIGKGRQGTYTTIVIPASTSTVASYAQVLPRSPNRTRAFIFPVDVPIVISTSLAEVQSTANIGATFPNGGYIGTGFSPEIQHEEAVYASNTSTSATCRVVVWQEYA